MAVLPPEGPERERARFPCALCGDTLPYTAFYVRDGKYLDNKCKACVRLKRQPAEPDLDLPPSSHGTASMPEPAVAPKPSGPPTIFAARSLQFECVTDMWVNIPKGTVRDEKGWHGPENVARLIAAKCLQPVAE